MFIVFDLDGTLANYEHRKGMLDKKNPDYDAFFAASKFDSPIYQAIELLKMLKCAQDVMPCQLEIWTGRSEGYDNAVRWETEKWLDRYGIYCPMRMRPYGDSRTGVELKLEYVDKYGKPDLVFEDDAKMVAMWRGMDVKCYQVDG